MTLETRIVALAEAVGADIKSLTLKQGDLTTLTTTAKSSLVAAINEVAAGGGGGAVIDDSTTATTSVWSSSKTHTEIGAAVAALVNSAPATLDTLQELAAALAHDPQFATTIASALAKRVRVDDVQAFTAAEMLQGCQNLGIGNYDRNFVADYTAAKS